MDIKLIPIAYFSSVCGNSVFITPSPKQGADLELFLEEKFSLLLGLLRKHHHGRVSDSFWQYHDYVYCK